MKPLTKILYSVLILLFIGLSGCKEDEVIPTNGLVANAGTDKALKVGELVILDGSLSFDKNNNPFEYEWIIIQEPQGSEIVLDVSEVGKAKFTPGIAGQYLIQLKITQANWQSVDDVLVTITTTAPNEPTAVTINQPISSNRTLTDIFEDPTKPDYLVTEDIDVRADLIIEPGVVIAFDNDKTLKIINGSIQAKGTAEKGIVFRGLANTRGSWRGIMIYTNSSLNEFDYVTVKHGGSNMFTSTGIKANVALIGSDISASALSIRNSSLSEGAGYGLYVQGQSYLNHFSKNEFNNNLYSVAYVPAHQLHMLDPLSTASGNSSDGIETSGTLPLETIVTWKKVFNGDIRVKNNITIKGGVTVDPGVKFRVSQNMTIEVLNNGYLKAQGTTASPISFKAYNAGQYWNGLYFNSINSNNILSHVEISDGGYSKIANAPYAANVYVGEGTLLIENTTIKNGLGYGVVTKYTDRVNQNLAEVNQFQDLQKGSVYPTILNYPDMPAVTGTWVDLWTLNNGYPSISSSFYNETTGVWFDGYANPWAMMVPGFGIRFDENGNFTWNIAEYSPFTGCESFSAEYITGTTTITNSNITFHQEYWRSKFVNSCDETQNVDTGVTPFELSLPYEITKGHNSSNNQSYWILKFTNPDGSSFSFYRKI